MKTLIKNAEVVIDDAIERLDVLIDDQTIAAIGNNLTQRADETVEKPVNITMR